LVEGRGTIKSDRPCQILSRAFIIGSNTILYLKDGAVVSVMAYRLLESCADIETFGEIPGVDVSGL
jgi:hypothetical protein